MTQDERGWRRRVLLCLVATVWVIGMSPAEARAGQGAAAAPGSPGDRDRGWPQGAQQLAERVAAGDWDTFTARVTVRRQLIGNDGRVVELGAAGPRGASGPATDDSEEFIWQRRRRGSSWTTTMTLVNGRTRTVRSMSGDVALPESPTVARVEDDEDGTAPRWFDRAGVQLTGPTEAVRQRFRAAAVEGTGLAVGVVDGVGGAAGATPEAEPGLPLRALGLGNARRPVQGREWVGALVMSLADRPSRMRALTNSFGRRTGLVRGLGRYVRQAVDPDHGTVLHEVLHEVLVDEQSAVPVEVNIVRGGALVSHSLFAYERGASGAVVRRGVRVEHLLETGPQAAALARVKGLAGARVVSEVSFTDIRLEQKGGR